MQDLSESVPQEGNEDKEGSGYCDFRNLPCRKKRKGSEQKKKKEQKKKELRESGGSRVTKKP